MFSSFHLSNVSDNVHLVICLTSLACLLHATGWHGGHGGDDGGGEVVVVPVVEELVYGDGF